jgi:hypothetical protein
MSRIQKRRWAAFGYDLVSARSSEWAYIEATGSVKDVNKWFWRAGYRHQDVEGSTRTLVEAKRQAMAALAKLRKGDR